MDTVLHTIRTTGKKELPKGTALQLMVGTRPSTVNVKLKLPGQKNFSELNDLLIVDGVLELPVKMVFISYASEDFANANIIAEKLWQDGFLTWFDKKDLLPGDNWKVRIEEAIEKADFILVLLSKSSCSKVGYVQREIKYALNQRELRPFGQRYIIPVMIEPCTLPRELVDIQYHIWSEENYDKLRAAMVTD